jgi:hypothetical protein
MVTNHFGECEQQQWLVDKINGHPDATWKAGFNDRFAAHTVSSMLSSFY